MKANAPDKLYLVPFGKSIIEPLPQPESDADTIWSSRPYDGADNIEYLRTDVFVKKVEDLLYDELNHGDMECSNIEALIERFKKRIKE